MRQRGGTQRARQNQCLIIGPWSHSNFTGSFPEREFGAAASSSALDLTGIHLRWFDRWLKDLDNGVDQEPPVTLFVMGVDRWRAEADWPLPDTQYRPFYLHSAGQANTLHGDGTLSAEPSGDEPADVFLYNPMRPVPTWLDTSTGELPPSFGRPDEQDAAIRICCDKADADCVHAASRG